MEFSVGRYRYSNGLLDQGETWTYTLTTTAPTQNAGTKIGRASCRERAYNEGGTASDSARATITYTNVAPAIHVVKSADPTSVSEGGVGSQSVTYTYLVTNTSPASTDPLRVVLDVDG